MWNLENQKGGDTNENSYEYRQLMWSISFLRWKHQWNMRCIVRGEECLTDWMNIYEMLRGYEIGKRIKKKRWAIGVHLYHNDFCGSAYILMHSIVIKCCWSALWCSWKSPLNDRQENLHVSMGLGCLCGVMWCGVVWCGYDKRRDGSHV